ncbi:Type 1 glutamine amidotransferase-like domain-containing protein [Kineosporia babensis]|uniref:Peptidase E n=1 Tax=Kineosporia babensis TaxID=499548 RepID=A0A9X1SUU3_9ACTN|nr:peptidase E [Kineosporia babensis]
MRLYLSSFRSGDQPEQMLALLGRPARSGEVAVIANAIDDRPEPERRTAVEREFRALAELGLRPVELDLRMLFGCSPAQATAALAEFSLVWVRGGNVFVLRQALALSGADQALIKLLQEDALVYAGYSAAACVLAPDLHGLEHCDDPSAVQKAYAEQARYDGLALLDYAVVPHVHSPGHPETKVLGEVADRYRADGIPHRTLRDGQAIVINGAS